MPKLEMPLSYDNKSFFYFRNGDYPIMHSHDDYWEFIYVTGGEYTHEINGKKRILKKNALCLLRPDDMHATFDNTGSSTYITYCVTNDYLTMFVNLLGEGELSELLQRDYIETYVSQAVAKTINEITEIYLVSPKDEYLATCNLFFLAFVNEIIKYFGKEERKHPYSASVETFIRLLDKPENLSRSLSDLIAETNYSYSHMNGVFKREVGVTPSDYLKEKRLSYAKRLLISTTYKHESIAETVGFATHSRFCVFFKERTGLTPSQYAAKYRIRSF